MKKKIFGAVVVAIAVGAIMNVNLNKTGNKGDLALENVEALAQESTETNNWNTSWPNSNSTSSNCTGIKDAQNVFSTITTVVDNSGVTGGNVNVTVGGTGGGVGATGSQGQSLYVTTTVNCGPLTGGCCNPSQNGVFTTKIN